MSRKLGGKSSRGKRSSASSSSSSASCSLDSSLVVGSSSVISLISPSGGESESKSKGKSESTSKGKSESTSEGGSEGKSEGGSEGTTSVVNIFESPSDIDYDRFLHNVKLVMDGKPLEWVIQPLDKVVGQQVNRDDCQVHPEVTGMVLIMIVKNESEIIRRCLDSVKGIIQGVCIVDTYSELPVDYDMGQLTWIDKLKDDMGVPERNERMKRYCPDIIKGWARENNMPCEVPIHYFTRATFQFDMSRTISFLDGRKYFPNAKYYITLDADMELRVKDEYNFEDLTADAYFLFQHTSTSRYPNVRIMKADTNSKVRACTHEYWTVKRRGSNGKFEETEKEELYSLEIIDHDDGRYKETKFIRDKYLLERDMLRERTEQDLRVRYLFYLAQSYMCLSRHDWAIDFYWLRHYAGHWDEERWYSLLNIGKIYLRKYDNKVCELSTMREALRIIKDGTGKVKREGIEVDEEIGQDVEKVLVKLSEMEKIDMAHMILDLTDRVESLRKIAIDVMHKAYEYRPTRAEPFYHIAKMYRELGNNDMGYYYASKASDIGYPVGDRLFVETSVYDYLVPFEVSVCGYYLPTERNKAVAAHRRLKLIIDRLPPDVKGAVMQNDKFNLG